MPSLTGLTLAQMRSATVAELRAAVTARFLTTTKAQIIRMELAVRDIDVPTQIRIADALQRNITRADKQPDADIIITRDAETNTAVETLTVSYTYYANGNIATHTRTITDAGGNVTNTQTVQYYQDGRQPTVS